MNHYLAHANDVNQTTDFGWMPMHHGWGMMGGSWFGNWLGISITVLIILLLIVLIRWLWIKGEHEKKDKNE